MEKNDFHKNIDKSKLGFGMDLCWEKFNSPGSMSHLEMSGDEKSQKVWSMKVVIKIRWLPYQRVYSISDNDDIKYLYSYFIFREKNIPK